MSSRDELKELSDDVVSIKKAITEEYPKLIKKISVRRVAIFTKTGHSSIGTLLNNEDDFDVALKLLLEYPISDELKEYLYNTNSELVKLYKSYKDSGDVNGSLLTPMAKEDIHDIAFILFCVV